MIVADCSIISALCLREDEPHLRGRVAAFRASVLSDVIIVPAIWPVELANALVNAERKKRINAADRDLALAEAFAMVSAVESPPTESDMRSVLDLAVRYRLSVYDALYVELARRTDSVLASLDDAMLRAAVSEGIAVLDGPDRPEPSP